MFFIEKIVQPIIRNVSVLIQQPLNILIVIEQEKIKVSTPADEEAKAPIDFGTMNWQNLLAYAKSKGIKAKTKANIIEELKKEQKGE